VTVGIRVRVADWVRRRTKMFEIAAMSPAQIEAAQGRHRGHNPVLDLIFGPMVSGVQTREETISARSGELSVRSYTPAGRSAHGVVVNFHGGGWVLGDLDGNDWTCSTVATQVGVQVVSVDYRLAPAHRFPAAVEDCYDALQWAATLDASAGGIAVMGDSAGGNLAAVMAQLCRDDGQPELLHQVLIYPATDLTMQSPSLVSNADAAILTRTSVDAFRAHYLGEHYLGADQYAAEDPRASPLLAPSLAGLPSALVITAEHDPIRDDGRRYADALRSAGVPVRHTDYVGAPHGFVSIPGLAPMAKQALAEICAELTRAFATHARGRGAPRGR